VCVAAAAASCSSAIGESAGCTRNLPTWRGGICGGRSGSGEKLRRLATSSRSMLRPSLDMAVSFPEQKAGVRKGQVYPPEGDELL
jgi:hypothetical protein